MTGNSNISSSLTVWKIQNIRRTENSVTLAILVKKYGTKKSRYVPQKRKNEEFCKQSELY